MADDPIIRFVDSTVKELSKPGSRQLKKKQGATAAKQDERPPKRILWHWRLELATLAVPFVLFVAFGPAILVIAGITVIALAVADALPTRLYWHHAVRRHVHNALRDTGVLDRTPDRSERKPLTVKITKVETTNSGERLALKLKGGGSLHSLEQRSADIKTNLSRGRRAATGLIFEANRNDASRPYMSIERGDPFRDAAPTTWPLLAARETSVWDPLPFGTDDHGDPITIDTMGEGHVLIGGATRAGKSVGLNLFVAQAALDPLSHNIGFDNQEVELSPWKPALGQFVGGNKTDAVNTLKAMQEIMERRGRELTAEGKRKVVRGDVVYNIFIDELAAYLRIPDFETLLMDLLQRSAKTGFRIVAGIQRPSGEVSPRFTDLRAQFTHRIAFRTKEAETTQMILGNRNAPAHDIPNELKGVFYLETDSTRAQRGRSHYLQEQDVATIARRVQENTQRDLDKELDKLTNPPPKPPSPPKATEQRALCASATLTEELLGSQPGLAKSTPQLVDESKLDRVQVSTVLGDLLKRGIVDRRLEFPDRKPSKTNPWLYWVVRPGSARNECGTGEPVD